MATWATFYPYLASHVPGCPDPVMDRALSQSAAEFFRRTRAWIEWLPGVTTAAGVREYALPLAGYTTGAEVVRIEQATINALPLPILSFRDASTNWANYEQPNEGILSFDRENFTTATAYGAGQLIEIQASLMPSDLATGIPDRLFPPYVDDIVAGARARLMLIPGTDFASPQLAIDARNAFERAIDNKTVDAFRGHTGIAKRVRASWC